MSLCGCLKYAGFKLQLGVTLITLLLGGFFLPEKPSAQTVSQILDNAVDVKGIPQTKGVTSSNGGVILYEKAPPPQKVITKKILPPKACPIKWITDVDL